MVHKYNTHILDFLEESCFQILAHWSVCVCEHFGQASLIPSCCREDMFSVYNLPGITQSILFVHKSVIVPKSPQTLQKYEITCKNGKEVCILFSALNKRM